MALPLIKPQILREGDTIGIAAPASPFDRQAFDKGVETLESMGFQVKIPEAIFHTEGYLAGSDADRAALVMELFQDDALRAIFCARGGFGSMKLLPLLDFDAMARHPKILVGFSDITALLVAIYKYCGMVTFHGPLVTTLGKGSGKTSKALLEAISSPTPLTLTPDDPVVLAQGQASGPVVGGNLTMLTHLMGTPYEPPLDGHILFLEDRGEAPYRIDRMLTQLDLGGHLDRIAGLVLGSFEGCGPLDEVCHIVKAVFQNTEIPILAGFDLGHGQDNMTVPLGLDADLDTEEGTLRFKKPAVVGATP